MVRLVYRRQSQRIRSTLITRRPKEDRLRHSEYWLLGNYLASVFDSNRFSSFPDDINHSSDGEDTSDDSDSDSEDDLEDESSDVEVKLEMEDEAVALQLFKESSEDTRDGAAEDQKQERLITYLLLSSLTVLTSRISGESQHTVQPNHAEPPSSSRPSTGLFERMNGIQTSGSFEAMMADLRRAAAERERQARLAGQVVDSETSDSSDDDSLPYFSPEPEAKPYIG